MLACEELFDKFDAFGNAKDFPKLILKEHCLQHEIKSSARINVIKDKNIK